jgi:hypothetical protein
MSAQFHGLSSIGLILLAVATAAVMAFQTSWLLGAGYMALSLLSSAAMVYAFCAKCPCQARCGHVLPGKLAARFTNRRPGPYTRVELAVVVVAGLLLAGWPQLWLWPHTGPFFIFWLLVVLALLQIRVYVCRACDNRYCPAHTAR